MEFQPSKYQINLFNAIKYTKHNILVSAVAGSGKTTSIVKSLELIPKNSDTIFLAFNKSIVEELEQKVPNFVQVSTLHSFGYRTLFKHYGYIKINEDKMFSTAVRLSKNWNINPSENKFAHCGRVSDLVAIMRQTLITKNEDEIFDLSAKYNIDIYSNEVEHAIETLQVANKEFSSASKDKRVIDFVDMIYIPVARKLKMKKFDVVFIDEIQDLNRAQQEIVRNIVKPTGRFVGVGDPKQSIYGFAGADFESFNRMKTLLRDTIELPLSVCYRCGKNIVKKAQGIVPYIEYFDSKEDGIVRYDGTLEEVSSGDWILCRNTKPLIFAFVQLLRSGKKVNIKGKEIGRGLVTLIKNTKAKGYPAMIKRLKVDRVRLKEQLIKRGINNVDEHEKIVAYTEKIEIIQVLSSVVKGNVDDLMNYIKDIFLDDNIPGITLSTIHKSKGLEANRVFVICDYLMPSKYARQEHELIQESNLEYVMITRAKKELIYIPKTSFNPDNVEREIIED